ncbi:ThiF family adenylyltransferase [Microbacterium terricola]|uniref:Adenylyltransferase/sulfurtransferase MoeZ n=1 Tax=Microbacterium terricola TaxID=344163 RepID=A0ABM8E0L5_9MICO|nr:ThiF family adenylyltransferase [Microbacterium terricola]UYK40784.1 ThiF family adenylyltransferase [Microbacterium terricola]BDV31473.1 adenylyltransferase/sulfurtransferase MoeZ [Microbacterium terricola]
MSFPPLVEPVPALSATEATRTARHRSLAGLGEVGQRRLRAAHVAIVGAGGLGSPAVLALAAAGVGTLTVIDDDTVEITNLQRQVMHRHEDVGARKVDSAVRVAADLAPETTVLPIAERLDGANAVDLLAGADIVLDGSDSFATRAAVAAACERLRVPLVWGTVQEFGAQLTVFWSAPPAGVDPVVLSDLYPPATVGEPPSCAAVGVLGALCLQVGALMATEAVKLIAGIGEPLLGRVLLIDALRARQSEVPLRAAATTGAPLEIAATDAAAPRIPEVTPGALTDDAVLVDVREAHEVAGGVIPGSRHVPLADLLADPRALSPLTADGPLVIVCQVGVRAARAARALHDVGIDASVLAGGMDAWSADGVRA